MTRNELSNRLRKRGCEGNPQPNGFNHIGTRTIEMMFKAMEILKPYDIYLSDRIRRTGSARLRFPSEHRDTQD